MSKFGKSLIQSAKEAMAIARGEAAPGTYRKSCPNSTKHSALGKRIIAGLKEAVAHAKGEIELKGYTVTDD